MCCAGLGDDNTQIEAASAFITAPQIGGDDEFLAYGAQLWSLNRASAISEAPVTYTFDGKQYVSLLVGWGGSDTILGRLGRW